MTKKERQAPKPPSREDRANQRMLERIRESDRLAAEWAQQMETREREALSGDAAKPCHNFTSLSR